jgi:hypothetical protein
MQAVAAACATWLVGGLGRLDRCLLVLLEALAGRMRFGFVADEVLTAADRSGQRLLRGGGWVAIWLQVDELLRHFWQLLPVNSTEKIKKFQRIQKSMDSCYEVLNKVRQPPLPLCCCRTHTITHP